MTVPGMSVFSITALVSLASSALAQSATPAQEPNLVLLDPAGRTLVVPTSWQDDRPVLIQIQASGEDSCEFRLATEWHDDVKEPAPLERNPLDPEAGRCGRKLPARFTVQQSDPRRAMLSYTLWKVLAADPVFEAEEIKKLRAELDRLGIAPETPALTTVTLGRLDAAIEAQGPRVREATRLATAADRRLKELESDAKLLTGVAEAAGVQRLLTMLDQIAAARRALDRASEARTTEERRRSDLLAARTRVEPHANGSVSEAASCGRIALVKVGGLLPSANAKSVHYDFVVPQSPAAPPGLVLRLLSTYPVVSEGEQLYAVVANRRLRDHPYPFVLSATRTAAAPPNLAPVRPTFDIVTKLIQPQWAVEVKRPTATRTCQAPIVQESLADAHRDSVLPFQDRLRGNDILSVTISTYRPHTTSDKETTTTEGPKSPVTTRIVVEESKQVDLIKDVKYPQIRALYRFNLATGVLVSWLRQPADAKVRVSANDPDTKDLDESRFVLDRNNGEPRIMPMFLFSTHLWRTDIQKPVWGSARVIPAPAIGFSLTSPADNVFLGFTSEVFPNVHVFGGWHNGRINDRIPARDAEGNLLPQVTGDDRDATLPVTRSVRKWDKSAGVAFNINLITGFFK